MRQTRQWFDGTPDGWRSAGAIAALGAVALVAAIGARARESGERYTDPQFGYSLSAPAGWTRKADMPRPFVAYLGPEDEGSQPNFSVYTEPAAHKTLAQYVKAAKDSIVKNKAMHLQGVSPGTLGGTRAEVLQSLVTATGHAPTVTRQVVAVRGGRGYVVTFSAAPAAIKRYLPVFGKVVSSFRWESAPKK